MEISLKVQNRNKKNIKKNKEKQRKTKKNKKIQGKTKKTNRKKRTKEQMKTDELLKIKKTKNRVTYKTLKNKNKVNISPYKGFFTRVKIFFQFLPNLAN
jgi:hypothetical protein